MLGNYTPISWGVKVVFQDDFELTFVLDNLYGNLMAEISNRHDHTHGDIMKIEIT